MGPARRPRNSEASPASTAKAAEKANTWDRPWWKAPEIRWGKNSLPVIMSCLADGSDDSANPGDCSACCSGLTPSKAANSEEVGGRLPTCTAA